MQKAFTYCPSCGSKDIKSFYIDAEKTFIRKWQCPSCDFELYNNIASAVGLVIFNSNGEVLLETRAKEPKKGLLVFPGGFTDPNETAEEAAIRECREEIGVTPLNVKYLCSFPNNYEFKNHLYKTCDMFFTAELPKSYSFNTQQSEVSALQWVKADSISLIEEIPLAFDSAKKTLNFYLSEKEENQEEEYPEENS